MASNESQPGGLPPPEHQTLAVDDTHYLGIDGMPQWHHTIHRIRALPTLGAPMTHMPYRFDTGMVRVDVAEGGTASPVHEVAEGMHEVSIELDEPLEPGRETVLDYSTFFNYSEAPPPLFRRHVGSRAIEHLGMTVVFNQLCLPAWVYQSEWDGYDEDSLVILEETAELERHRADPAAGEEVHASYEGISNRTVGFRWEWPQA